MSIYFLSAWAMVNGARPERGRETHNQKLYFYLVVANKPIKLQLAKVVIFGVKT